MDELSGSVLADLRKIGRSCIEGRLPRPLGPPEAKERLMRRFPTLGEQLDRSTTTIKNVKLTSVLGTSLPKDISDIIHVLELWSQKPAGPEKHEDAVLLVDAYGDINVHTAMTVMEYRDLGTFRLCRCRRCQEFFNSSDSHPGEKTAEE